MPPVSKTRRRTARFHAGDHFGQECRLIGRLVQHPEAQGEVCRLIHSKAVLPVRCSRMRSATPVRHSARRRTPASIRFLQVNANDLPSGADEPCQRDREVAHAAADVESGLARLHQSREDALDFWISRRSGLSKVAEPPRADVAGT